VKCTVFETEGYFRICSVLLLLKLKWIAWCVLLYRSQNYKTKMTIRPLCSLKIVDFFLYFSIGPRNLNISRICHFQICIGSRFIHSQQRAIFLSKIRLELITNRMKIRWFNALDVPIAIIASECWKLKTWESCMCLLLGSE